MEPGGRALLTRALDHPCLSWRPFTLKGIRLGPPGETHSMCGIFIGVGVRCSPQALPMCSMLTGVGVVFPERGRVGGGSGRLAPSRVDRYARGLQVARSGNALGAVNLRLLRVRLTASNI